MVVRGEVVAQIGGGEEHGVEHRRWCELVEYVDKWRGPRVWHLGAAPYQADAGGLYGTC